ncbi:hypothetical protein IV203_036977 [Nitzschia inconspicua]|uniref:Uncharacterized protein n=1 Tax=Nitzschia inconspicua TaxID=303405 RepID=A0A9K3LJ22_9STRA|nr:hypothetical protein IV203_036977 [Nitzschia inconspicua]
MAHYGTEPIVVAVMWEMLIDDGWTKKKRGCKPKHLLFALKFKKSYDAEMITALALGVDEKTYRKWVWFMIEGIAQLKTLVLFYRLNKFVVMALLNAHPNTIVLLKKKFEVNYGSKVPKPM